jgi:hypothetical protein
MSEFPHVCIDRRLSDVRFVPGRARIALLKAKLFEPGTTLRYVFSGGTTANRRKVEEVVDKVKSFCNLGLRPARSGEKSEIRITFHSGGGAWSYIGTDVLNIPQNQATMNLGFDDPGTYEHEFGHTLGCIHEHQNPKGGIKWNREQVIRDLSGPPNHWDRQTIEHNIFHAYSMDQINGTVFDPKSVMLYSIPARWTTDGFSSKNNGDYSEEDRAFLGKMYPFKDGPAIDATIIDVSDLHPVQDKIGQPQERDLFAFDAKKKGHYRLEALGPTAVVLRLFGDGGVTDLIAETNNAGIVNQGISARMDLELAAGRYYVQVAHADERGTGSYGLRVIHFAEDDPLLFPAESEGVIIRSPGAIFPGEYSLSKLGGNS